MSNLFCAALTKSGRVFVATSRQKIKTKIQKNKIAWRNVVIYFCQPWGDDGEIKIKQKSRKKVKFRPNSAQIKNLRVKCREFVRS